MAAVSALRQKQALADAVADDRAHAAIGLHTLRTVSQTAPSKPRSICRRIAALGVRYGGHDPQPDRDEGADDDPSTGDVKKISPISQSAEQHEKAEYVKAECGHGDLSRFTLATHVG